VRGLARWPLATLGFLACCVTTAGIAGVSFDPFATGQGPELLLQFMLGLAAVIGVGEVSQVLECVFGVGEMPWTMLAGQGSLGPRALLCSCWARLWS